MNRDLVFSRTLLSHEMLIPLTADEFLEPKTESFTVQLAQDREDENVLLILSQSTISIRDNDSRLISNV